MNPVMSPEIAVEQKDYLMAESLIPHRRQMMLIERIKNPNKSGLQAETKVREAWPMYENGAVSSLICIELIAQSVSAFGTWRRGAGAVPRVGLLVGIKRAEFTTATLPLDIKLRISVEKVSKVGNYGVFKGEVASGPTNLCKAVVQVIDPDKDILQRIKAIQTQGLRGNRWRLWEND
jgi:predicted hotdog family 3-hydroxylacyl-ACP dehydratase